MKNFMKNQPGTINLLQDDETLITVTPPTPVMDTTFERDGRTWRVSVVAGSFIIGTAIDARRDKHGEVSRESDIIKVMM